MTQPAKERESSNSSPLDVLIVTQPIDGGVGVCVRQLTEAAVAAGHHTVVASPDSANGAFALATVRAGAGHVTLLDHQRRPQPADLRAVLALRRMMRDRDVVHLHSSKAGAVGRAAAATLGRRRPRLVFTPHAWSWLVGGRVAFAYRWIERLLARVGDAIVAVSETEAAEGRQVLGRSSRKVTTIPNGVDLERFSPVGPQVGRDESAPLILCVGRLTRQKGQDVALQALAQMKHATTRIRFVGIGESQTDLESLAGKLGVNHRVEWAGAVDDTAPEFRTADIVLAPSRWEGLSLVFLEAMACGVPLVASDVQGAEVIGDAGVVVPVEDPAAIAGVLDELLADPARRKEMGAEARRRAADHDVRRTTARNLDLWRTLVTGGDVRPTPSTEPGPRP